LLIFSPGGGDQTLATGGTRSPEGTGKQSPGWKSTRQRALEPRGQTTAIQSSEGAAQQPRYNPA